MFGRSKNIRKVPIRAERRLHVKSRPHLTENAMLAISEEIGLVFETGDLPLDLQAEARRIAMTYRILLDWSPELGFTALCVELPRLTARAASADTCVDSLFEQAAAHVGSRLIQGLTTLPSLRPVPRRQHLTLSPPIELATAANGEPIDPPAPDQLHRMARWIADQYRISLQWFDGSCYATCVEIPEAASFGATPSECVVALRRLLCKVVSARILENQMPPEPVQEIERRTLSRRRAA